MKILILGCKEWPYGYSAGYEEFVGGGTGRYINNLCKGLLLNGIEVELITRRFPSQRKYEKNGDLHIHRVRCLNNFYLRLPTFAFFSFLSGLPASKRIDVIHGNGLFGCMTAVLLSKISGKPCITTPHGLSSRQNRRLGNTIVRLLGKLEKFVYTKACMVIFLSSNERDNFLNTISLNEEKYCIIESATEIPETITRKEQDEDDERLVVLYIGRLVEGKGLEEFVDSYVLLPAEIRKSIAYVIVGDGYLRKLLQKKVREVGVSDNIRFTGFQKDPARFYANSDIYVLPSTHEGFPLALLEAMSWGIPCIINDFGVPIPRDTILVMPDNSPYTIAEYVKRLALNPDYREILSIKSRRLVQNRFSIERLVKEYINCYKMLM